MEKFVGKTYLAPELYVLALENDVVLASGDTGEWENGDLTNGDIRW